MFTRIKLFLILGLVATPLMLLGYLAFGDLFVKISAIIFTALLLFLIMFADKFLLELLAVKELSYDNDEIYQMVKRLSYVLQIEPPHLYVFDKKLPNCLVIGTTRKNHAIIIDKSLWNHLQDDEMESVIIRSLVALKKQDVSMATVVVLANYILNSTITLAMTLARKVLRVSDRNAVLVSLVLLPFISPLMDLLSAVVIKRNKIFNADEVAFEVCDNPSSLVSAFYKIAHLGKGDASLSKVFLPLCFVDNISLEHHLQIGSASPTVEERLNNIKTAGEYL